MKEMKNTPRDTHTIKSITIIKMLFFLFLFSSLLAATSYSQVHEEWVQRYNGPGNNLDGANSIAVDAFGNVYVTGWSVGTGTYADYATIKYNTNGVQQWVQRYNGPGAGSSDAISITVDVSGNVYVTGSSWGYDDDYATIKYNTNGIQQWIQRYNGPGNLSDAATSIAVDDLGNVFVTGRTWGNGTSSDYTTIKYDANGVQQWVQTYNGPGNNYDAATSIAVDSSGNVYVTGYSYGSGTGFDYTTLKYNTNGVQQWIQRYNGPGNGADLAFSMVVDGSGDVYVTGQSDGNGTGSDYATIKYNASGVQQWVQRYNGPGNYDDVANAVAVDGTGDVFVTGVSDSDYTTIKYSSSGVQLWTQRYNGPGNGDDEATSIAIDSSGNVYVTGWSNGDYATVKYNTNGIQMWIQRYNGPGNGWDAATSIAVDGSGNVYVTGGSDGNGTSYDYATIKYSQNIGIKRISSEVPDKFVLYQNYPNPFNPSTKIKFEIPLSPLSKRGVGGFVTLKIYDLLGREVANLVNEKLMPGSYEVEWDASNYPSGVYFYKLTANSFIESKMMVLIK
jgi:hypothetical protein